MKLRRRSGGEFNPEEMGEGGGLNVVNLIDMFVIIIIFLLKSYSASTEANISVSPDLQLPISSTDKDIKEFINITIRRDAILVDKKVIARISNWQVEGIKPDDLFIPSLYNEIEKKKEKILLIQQYNPNVQFKGEVNIIAHKETPFFIIKKVIFTIGRAEFGELKLITQKET